MDGLLTWVFVSLVIALTNCQVTQRPPSGNYGGRNTNANTGGGAYSSNGAYPSNQGGGASSTGGTRRNGPGSWVYLNPQGVRTPQWGYPDGRYAYNPNANADPRRGGSYNPYGGNRNQGYSVNRGTGPNPQGNYGGGNGGWQYVPYGGQGGSNSQGGLPTRIVLQPNRRRHGGGGRGGRGGGSGGGGGGAGGSGGGYGGGTLNPSGTSNTGNSWQPLPNTGSSQRGQSGSSNPGSVINTNNRPVQSGTGWGPGQPLGKPLNPSTGTKDPGRVQPDPNSNQQPPQNRPQPNIRDPVTPRPTEDLQPNIYRPSRPVRQRIVPRGPNRRQPSWTGSPIGTDPARAERLNPPRHRNPQPTPRPPLGNIPPARVDPDPMRYTPTGYGNPTYSGQPRIYDPNTIDAYLSSCKNCYTFEPSPLCPMNEQALEMKKWANELVMLLNKGCPNPAVPGGCSKGGSCCLSRDVNSPFDMTMDQMINLMKDLYRVFLTNCKGCHDKHAEPAPEAFYGGWSAWGKCDCRTGIQSRERQCYLRYSNGSQATADGDKCEGEPDEYVFCDVRDSCPVCITDCEGLADGDYHACSNCSDYITCKDESLTPVKCPTGKEFDGFMQRCEKAPSTSCTLTPTPSSCKGLSDGYFPVPDRCDAYVKCTSQRGQRENCPAGKEYHHHAKICLRGMSPTCVRPLIVDNKVDLISEARRVS